MANISGCNESVLYMPALESWDDCSAMADRLAAVEQRLSSIEGRLGNKVDVEIAMTDTNNREVAVTVLAE